MEGGRTWVQDARAMRWMVGGDGGGMGDPERGQEKEAGGGVGYGVPGESGDPIILEVHDKPAALDIFRTAVPKIVGVVPAVLMEAVLDHR